jgi:Flp pilus assembly protein TadD
MSANNDALRLAIAAAQDDPLAGLRILDDAIAAARSASDREAIGVLAKHAGVLAEAAGDLEQSAAYYREAFDANPEDGYACIALGMALRARGRTEEARSAFDCALKLGTLQKNDEVVLMARRNLARN